MAERVLGKDEVTSSTLVVGSAALDEATIGFDSPVEWFVEGVAPII